MLLLSLLNRILNFVLYQDNKLLVDTIQRQDYSFKLPLTQWEMLRAMKLLFLLLDSQLYLEYFIETYYNVYSLR